MDKSIYHWLVVSTHLKNISQIGSFPQVGVKIKNIWNHHTVPWSMHVPVDLPWNILPHFLTALQGTAFLGLTALQSRCKQRPFLKQRCRKGEEKWYSCETIEKTREFILIHRHYSKYFSNDIRVLHQSSIIYRDNTSKANYIHCSFVGVISTCLFPNSHPRPQPGKLPWLLVVQFLGQIRPPKGWGYTRDVTPNLMTCSFQMFQQIHWK